MRPHCGNGGSSSSRTTNERGETAQPRTTAPAARLANMKPPLKAKVEVSEVVAHSAAVPATPASARSRCHAGEPAAGRCRPATASSPMAMAAPTSSAWARVSVP